MLVLEVLEKSETKVEDEILGEWQPDAIVGRIIASTASKIHTIQIQRKTGQELS